MIQTCRAFLAFSGAALIVALATPASAETCDMLVSFEHRGGQIDRGAYDRIGTWLRANPTRTAGIVETAFSNGARSLCITSPTREGIPGLFQDVGTLLSNNNVMPPVTLTTAQQQKRGSKKSSRVRGKGYANDRRPPRDNGINNQPSRSGRY